MDYIFKYTIKLNFIGFDNDEISKQAQAELEQRFAVCKKEKSFVAVETEHKPELGDLKTVWSDKIQPRDINAYLERLNKFEYFIVNESDRNVVDAHRASKELDEFCSDKAKFPIVIYQPRANSIDVRPTARDYANLVSSEMLLPDTENLAKELATFIGDHYIMEKIGRIFTDGYWKSTHDFCIPSPPQPVGDDEVRSIAYSLEHLWDVMSDMQKEFAQGVGAVSLEGSKEWSEGRDVDYSRYKQLQAEARVLAAGRVKAVIEPPEPDMGRWYASGPHR